MAKLARQQNNLEKYKYDVMCIKNKFYNKNLYQYIIILNLYLYIIHICI